MTPICLLVPRPSLRGHMLALSSPLCRRPALVLGYLVSRGRKVGAELPLVCPLNSDCVAPLTRPQRSSERPFPSVIPGCCSSPGQKSLPNHLWEPVRNAGSPAPPRASEAEVLGQGLSNVDFDKPLRKDQPHHLQGPAQNENTGVPCSKIMGSLIMAPVGMNLF